MRKWLPLVGLFLMGSFATNAQIVTLFFEDFDSTTVATTSEEEDNISGAVVAGGWNINTSVSVSTPNSMRSQRTPNKTKYLYTPFFSTANLTNARLEFDHIAKLNLVQQGRVQYSVDSGATWTSLPPSTYLGSSPGYSGTVYFNGSSYANPNGTPYWDPFTNSTPANTWWAHETFDLTTIMVDTANPYTNCQIRWALVDINPNPGITTYSGWYIDNIDVTGSICELQPPIINWNFSTARQPVGPRYQLAQPIRLEASDAGTGVDSVMLFYRVNGGPDTAVLMTAATSGSCVTLSQYFYTFPALTIGDTVEWRVEVQDCACPNFSYFPDQAAANPYAKYWIDPSPPAKCGPTSTNSFPYIVATFPFAETFSNPALWAPGSGTGGSGSAHRGTWPLGNPPQGRNWQVSPLPTSAGYGWSVRTGPTATAQTGPDGDATTGSGSYLYTEASQGNTPPVQTSPLKTPCFDLPPNSCAVLEFKYHMYGADMNATPRAVLRVDVDTSTGTNTDQYVNGLIQFVGQQNSGSASNWLTAIVPLEDYAGQTVNFRFLGVKRTSGARQDIAIDDIQVYEPSPVDMELVNFDNPVNGLCSYSSTEDIDIVLRSKGCAEQDTIPVGFSVSLNGGTPVIANDFIYDTVALGDVISHTYVPKANLSGFGTYEIYAWVDMPGDGDRTNDTIGPLVIEHIQPINNFPYVLTFDDPSWVYGGGNISNPGTFGTTDWVVLPPHNSADVAFVIGREVTEDYNTGPRRDMSNFGQYLYTDSRNVGQNFARWELDRCVDISGMTNPSISFWYHMYGANIDFCKVQVQLDGSTAWADIPGGTISGTQQTVPRADWKWQHIDLTPYNSGLVRLRFLVRTTGTGNATDLAIDNLMIWDEDGQTDVGAAIITNPLFGVNLLAPTPPDLKVKVRNYGESSVSNIPLTVEVTDLCDPSKTNTVNYTIPGPIPAHAGSEITLPTPPQYYQGAFSIRAYTAMAGDANGWNDSALVYSNGQGEKGIPYTNEDFDSCAYDTKGWFAQGRLQAWEHGTPQKGGNWNSAFSSPNAWTTGRRFDYQNTSEYLRVPPLVGFDTVVGAILRFRHRFDFNASDGGRVEFFQGGQWNQFGFASTQVGVNWYDDAGVPAFNGEEAWTGNQPWTLSEFPLLIWNFNTNPLRLRYAVETTSNTSGGQGWSIDDFNVIVPPQNSVSPYFGDTKAYLVVPNDSATIVTRITNTGEKTLQGCLVRFGINGTWSQWDTVTQANWFKGRNVRHEFSFKTPPLPPGVYNIDIETSRPVSDYDSLPKADNRPADDLYSFSVTVLDEVTPTRDSSAYCNDFEDPTRTPLVALHSFNKQLPQEWEYGTPVNPALPGANSGVNAWSTDLDSNYEFNTESALHTPFFNLVPDTSYEFSFYHQMKSEQYHDGGGIEFSFNGGITWYALGAATPNGSWYNTNHVTSLDRLSGGWSGDVSWTRSEAVFKVDTPGTVVFRFRFAADYTIENAGWTVDDFCFVITDKSVTTGPISIDELESSAITYMELYPNPSDLIANLNVMAAQNGDAQIQVTNLVGQVLYETQERLTVGKNHLQLNTSEYAGGVYIVHLYMNGEQHTQKFIVTHE